ncbi:MAG: nucleoside 2-deoxyribosyltransferase [Pseudomonadota bacterium]
MDHSDDQGYVYLAAGLFNLGTNFQNAYIANRLEEHGYRCFLPQRDGFEVARFVEFLQQAKDNDATRRYASEIAHFVPYYLDLGYFLSRSIAVVASLDDPLDSGMIVEISYARLSNLPVIGFRSDIRSPLGNVSEEIAINPFPVRQCDVYIKAATPTGDLASVYRATDAFVETIESELRARVPLKHNRMATSDNPVLQDIVKGAAILFDGLSRPFGTDAMREIANRYVQHKDFFDAQQPKFLAINT